ncbi:ribonucleotide reductase inhibitor-domain-containing protein [Nemania diffusa]|nr:ribonucleotide reductase inhibitor-domain-containing protein [Nemania diffusa]
MRLISPKHALNSAQRITAMSAPRTKRQFAGAASDPAQRQITSFFTSATNAGTSSTSTTSYIGQPSSFPSTAERLDSTPDLPASVQSNLLSVGMRIRKSVPEGYKTGDYNAFALWDESDANSAIDIMGEGQRSRANAFSSPRELLPFCGIHKVGGLDTQPEGHHRTPATFDFRAGTSATPVYPSGYGVRRTGEDDDMPGLTSSQDSIESNASNISLRSGASRARTKKRIFVEDEDEIPGELNIWRYNHNTNLSPRGLAPNNNGRAMAVPSKGRLRAKFSGTSMAMSGVGQENLMVVDNDFGEAEFLDQGVWEVDMNDA